MTQDKWLNERLAYIRGLKAPNDQQRLMLILAEKGTLSADESRKLNALIRAEKAAERAQKARADVARIMNAEKALLRKARDHELYQSAGLLILAGLVDTKTGIVDVTAGGMSLKVHFPPKSVADLKSGDQITLHMGFSKK